METRRLFIRDFMEEDWRYIHSYCSDEEVTKYTFWGPNTDAETQEFIQKAVAWQLEMPRKRFEMAIICKADEQMIGNCCLSIEGTNAELGYCLRKESWGCGYASEAAKALLAFGFGEKKLHRIYATCRPQNIGSAKVMEKAGMKKEGHLREHIRAKATWLDSYLYSILEQEYHG